MSTSKSLLTALFLLSAVLAPINAQDAAHTYWEFNPNSEGFDSYDHDIYFEECVEDTINGNYICATNHQQNQCDATSSNDVSLVKIDYNGNELAQYYLCELDYNNNEDPLSMTYSQGYLYFL